jgi:tryptophanyl-tRNA synthetase
MRKLKRVLTGDRPTGCLHLGHYVGSLKNRLKLQDEYECFFIIADLQVLTDHLEKYEEIQKNVFEIMCDYLAVGLREDNIFFIQSQVPELTELTVYFSFLVKLPELQRNPTLKEESKMYGVKKMSLGFLSYPVSQAADILFCKPHLVPVGRDQLPHIELAREVARSFNRIFGKKVFPFPQAVLSECPILIGIDGKHKMSKSLNNHIAFAHTPEETTQRILSAYTDPLRPYRKDLGHPEECLVFKYHSIFFPQVAQKILPQCKKARIGCKECKLILAKNLNSFLAPIRKRRNYYHSHPKIVWEILTNGTKRAREVAIQTLKEVRKAMRLSYPF